MEAEVASAAGTNARIIAQVDLNGAGNGAELGLYALVWVLMAQDGSLQVMAPLFTSLSLLLMVLIQLLLLSEDANVTLVGGSVATFVNGDLCLDSNGKLVVLANNGSGTY